MDGKKKTRFLMPEAVIVDFKCEDIVTASSQTEGGNNWDEYPDGEEF